MKNKKIIITGIFFITVSFVYGQKIWNSALGQYAFNPAGGGMNEVGELSSAYYNTFGIAGNNPVGFLVMGTAPFPNDNMAAGFRITSESGGVLNHTMAEATYIYKIPVFSNSRLSFGLSAVYNQLSIQRDRMNAQHPDDPVLNAAQSGFWGDANFGVSLNEVNKYYFGLGVYNLIGGRTNWRADNFTNRAGRLLSVSGMYTLGFMDGDAKLETTGLAMSYFTMGAGTLNYDLSTRFIFKKSAWFGLGYAPNTFKILTGVYFQNFAIGYAGGIGMGDLSDQSYAMPKHELFFRIEFNSSKTSRAATTD